MIPSGRYIAILGGLLCIMAAIWTTAVVPRIPPSTEARWVNDIMKAKREAAGQVSGPRILVAGGSGTHFGIDTKLIEQATGVPSFNLGGHGDLGLVYLLEMARRTARAGDTVILAIEYHLMDFDTKPPPLLREYVRSFDRDYLASAPLHHLPLFLFWTSPEQILRNAIQARSGDSHMVLGKFPLTVASVDSHGNETVNRAALVDTMLRQRVAGDSRLSPSPRPDRAAMAAIGALLGWAKSNAIRVVATWPNVFADPRYTQEAFTRYFAAHQTAMSDLGVDMIGTPGDALVPLEGMFDTMYHPNDEGRADRTKRLVALLCVRALTCGADRTTALRGSR